MRRLVISLILVIMALAVVPGADAWQSSYSHRQQITITNPTTSEIVNYPVNISFDTKTIYDAGHLQDDCEDIAFADSSDNELYYYNISCNIAGNTSFYVNVTIPVAGETIYVYYGNATKTATTYRDGTFTFPWFDDFEDHADTAAMLETWEEVSGAVTLDTGTVFDGTNALKVNDDGANGIARLNQSGSSHEAVYLQYMIRSTASSDDGYIGFDSGAATRDQLSFGYPTADKWGYSDSSGTWQNSGVTATSGNWYFVEMVYNFSSKKQWSYSDFTAITENNAVYATSPSPTYIRFTQYTNGQSLYIDNLMGWQYIGATDPSISFAAEESAPTVSNVTLTLGVDPTTLYNLTSANFSIYYNESNGNAADITVNLTVNGVNISVNPTEYTDVAADTTLYVYVEYGNYSRNDNVALAVNLTTNASETSSSSTTETIQNSPATSPDITFTSHSIIIGDTLAVTGSSTDDDNDTLSYWYVLGFNNNTNITGWNTSINYAIGSARENDTFRLYVMADDGIVNSSMNTTDINVTRIAITWPADQTEYYGKDFYFSFNVTVQRFQPCSEIIGNTTYDLGNITGDQNHSRTVWYGNHIYNVTCYSLQDSSRVYYKSVNFTNYYANWTVSIMTENEWTTPLNITEANLSIIVSCDGGETYVYNFTGTEISGVKPPCDVDTVSAQVNYATDSYLRERLPPCEGTCDVEMYMVDAMIYTVLQIPIYMSDYQYYDSKIELYKLSGGNHYTIAEGYFDVEHKYVTYLTKDNTYLLRLTTNGQIRDIGFLYAATATAQYLSLSQISLRPDITLISDNILMSAEFDDPTLNQSTLRIQYQDLINMTESVRIQIYNQRNNTAWYDNTITGSSNFTISINNVDTTRQSVVFTVEHDVLGNSPIPYTIGVGAIAGFDIGFAPEYIWLYNGFAFFMVMVTSWVITPENRLPGYILLLAELGIFSAGTWLAGYASASLALFVAFVAAGIIYEIRHKGVS